MSSSGDVPIKELALLYLEYNHGGLSTPENYVDEFKRIQQAMEAHLPKPEVSAYGPPITATQPSYWRK